MKTTTKLFFTGFFLLMINFSVMAQEKMILDNFKNAQCSGGQIFSNTRYWYSFGGASISCSNNDNNKYLVASGNSNSWTGFGIDPGPNGNNGAQIPTKSYNSIYVDLTGNASGVKLELYDNNYKSYELWIDINSNSSTGYILSLPESIKGNNIAKIQFVFSPGKYDINLKTVELIN